MEPGRYQFATTGWACPSKPCRKQLGQVTRGMIRWKRWGCLAWASTFPRHAWVGALKSGRPVRMILIGRVSLSILANWKSPTSIPKCNTGHLRREGGARAAQMAGRRGLRLSGNGGSGPGTAAVPSGRRISGLSGQRKAAAGAGRVRPGAGRAQPDRSPDGRDGLIRSTPSRRGHPRCREAGRRCQGGRARRNTSAGVR